MTNIEITKQNIINFGYMAGKPAGNKGTAIYGLTSHFASYWSTNNEPQELVALKEKLSQHDLDALFVSAISFEQDKFFEFRIDNFQAYEASLVKYNLKDLIASDFAGVRHASIQRKPALMGYISVSKYDKDLDSQKRLLKDLISLSSVELYGDIENDTYDVEDECQEFKFHNNEYWDGGSKFLEHGESYTVETEENCLYVDGRCSPHNNDVADDFWMHGFDEGGWLKEIDPDDTIAVYHRKGKDFYIGYTLEVEEQELIWREEDESYDVDDYESDTFFYASYTPDDEKIEKVKECLESMKEDFEFRSYINNELEMDSYDDCNDWSYNDGVFDLYLLDLIFNDRNEIKNWVFEVIDTSDKTTKEACIEANNKLIAEHVTFNVDMSIEVEHVDYFSTKEPTKETYNQLKVIKRLQNRLGYELVWSLVNARGNTYGFAIKQDDQEYHFELKELFEEDVNPIEFVQDCLVAINRRRIESISIAELVEKASHVFVGIDDSYAVGNCEFGTREFINRHRIDTNVIGGIRGDALLELETSQFTKNMVMHKIVQISHNGGVAC